MELNKEIVKINNLNFEFSGIRKSEFKLSIENLNIFRGKITTILGRSGSGKSTLLDIIGLILEPNSFSIYDIDYSFDGIKKYNHADLWANNNLLNEQKIEHVGYIFQRSFFLQEITIEENIRIPMLIKNIPKEVQTKKIHIFLQSELFSEKERKNGKELAWECSGGQLQRLALFRAIAHEPTILFLDEPTGNLDPFSANKVFSFLVNWIKENSARSIVLVTHDIELAERYADYIYVINNENKINEKNKFIKKDDKWFNLDLLIDKELLTRIIGEIYQNSD